MSVDLYKGQAQATHIKDSLCIHWKEEGILDNFCTHWFYLKFNHGSTTMLGLGKGLPFLWSWPCCFHGSQILTSFTWPWSCPFSGVSIQKSLLTQLLLTAHTVLEEGYHKSFKSSGIPMPYNFTDIPNSYTFLCSL